MTTNTNIHANTPTISVTDNRGLGIRQLVYYRKDVNTDPEERISFTQYNALGHQQNIQDARLTSPNFQYINSLSGQVLKTEGVDNGSLVQLSDIEGRPLWQQDGRDTIQRFEYEEGGLGRITTMIEHSSGDTEQIRERFVYDDNATAGYNLQSQLVKHYDTAGLLTIESRSISGQTLQQSRNLLKNLSQETDWQGDETNWESLLDISTTYTTEETYDVLDNPLNLSDAKDNLREMTYNIAGQLKSTSLTPKNGSKTTVLESISYSPAGQVLQENAGNGVRTGYQYEPETQRLIRLSAMRPDTDEGSFDTLQDFSYTYDPVGNITSVKDEAVATSYYKNQQIDALRTFTYDTIYQLTQATGRENDSNSTSSVIPDDPTIPINTNQMVNYTRNYAYDAGGNLEQIKHTGAASYTTNILVSGTSNRAIKDWETGQTDIEGQFDANGNLLALQPGQPLQWNKRNQLESVTIIEREGDTNDAEYYRYTGDGMRLVKYAEQLASGSTTSQQVIYLPGLELRIKKNGATVKEELHVLTMEKAGRAGVRMLHWESGKPTDITDDQVRYSFDDHLGSSLLELDEDAEVISQEEYFPYGGTAVWAARSQVEADYKTIKYSGKERDTTGLYYYGYRYYQSWIGRWLNTDPEESADGLNLYRMVQNNPVTLVDPDGTRSYRFYTAVEATLEFMQEQDSAADAIRRGSRLTYLKAAGKSLAKGIFTSSLQGNPLPFLYRFVPTLTFLGIAILGPERFGKWMIGKMQKYLSKIAARHPYITGAALGGITATAFGGDTAIGAAVGTGAGMIESALGRPEHTTLSAPAGGMAVGIANQHGATRMGRLGAGIGGAIGGLIASNSGEASRAGYWAGIGGALGSQLGRRLDNLVRIGNIGRIAARLTGSTRLRLLSMILRHVPQNTGTAEASLSIGGGIAGGVGGVVGPGSVTGGIIAGAASVLLGGAALSSGLALGAAVTALGHITGVGSTMDDTVSSLASSGIHALRQSSTVMSWARWGTARAVGSSAFSALRSYFSPV
ncbi:MAG: hypothetical protein GKR88_05840 [Flavobacteriaceae bacterium]|nr:MAG: hypothetical protein GKR88_05840 [Flavobacteriaceae bacterium]